MPSNDCPNKKSLYSLDCTAIILPLNSLLTSHEAISGEGGIRTPGSTSATTDFESAAFVHSATSPINGFAMLPKISVIGSILWPFFGNVTVCVVSLNELFRTFVPILREDYWNVFYRSTIMRWYLYWESILN